MTVSPPAQPRREIPVNAFCLTTRQRMLTLEQIPGPRIHRGSTKRITCKTGESQEKLFRSGKINRGLSVFRRTSELVDEKVSNRSSRGAGVFPARCRAVSGRSLLEKKAGFPPTALDTPSRSPQPLPRCGRRSMGCECGEVGDSELFLFFLAIALR